jgi:uncharacterized membrane protein
MDHYDDIHNTNHDRRGKLSQLVLSQLVLTAASYPPQLLSLSQVWPAVD